MKATRLCMKAPKIWNDLCNSVTNSVQDFKHKYNITLEQIGIVLFVCLSSWLAGAGMSCT